LLDGQTATALGRIKVHLSRLQWHNTHALQVRILYYKCNSKAPVKISLISLGSHSIITAQIRSYVKHTAGDHTFKSFSLCFATFSFSESWLKDKLEVSMSSCIRM